MEIRKLLDKIEICRYILSCAEMPYLFTNQLCSNDVIPVIHICHEFLMAPIIDQSWATVMLWIGKCTALLNWQNRQNILEIFDEIPILQSCFMFMVIWYQKLINEYTLIYLFMLRFNEMGVDHMTDLILFNCLYSHSVYMLNPSKQSKH